jgi:branched-chain amino acid transport system permease protein
VPFWVAVPIASAVSGAFAMLIGLPALRIKGLFLAVVTMGFTITVDVTLFDKQYFGWLLPEGAVKRPTLPFIDFEQDRPMYYLCALCLVLAIVIVMNLRRSRFGRLLIAMRENEANVQSFGVSAVRLKLTAFAVSGALAGFAGAVFVHQQRGLNGQSFDTAHSINTFVFTVLGGIGSVGGALLGSAFQNLLEYFLPSNDFFARILQAFQQGGSTLLVLFVAPAGLIGLVVSVRDAWLRIIAQRRQIVVPSLFADYDAEALERRLIPLADASANSGLAALGPGAHFRLRSELHGGETTADQRALHGRNEDRLAIGAAGSSFGDSEAEAPHEVVGATLVALGDDTNG